MLLSVSLPIAAFFYYLWETGALSEGSRFDSPDGERAIEIVSLEGAGFFRNEGQVLRFYFYDGVNRYPTPWETLSVHWAQNSHTALLMIGDNGQGEPEIRIVHQPGHVDGGTPEIREQAQDLIPALQALCREKNAKFTFVKWEEDGATVIFRFETPEAAAGSLRYHDPSGTGTVE